MTYHDFLREVWRAANKGVDRVTPGQFDAAVLPALRRMRPGLYGMLQLAIKSKKVDPDHIRPVLQFLENNWASPEGSA